MMNTRIAVIALWAEDVPTCAHFYRDVLELPLIDQHTQRPHFDLGGSTLVILQGKPSTARATDPTRFPIFALAVDDLQHLVERLKAHSVTLPWGIEKSSEARWVMFHDPAGNLIELVEYNSE
jgi:catechol-2,3-dioxygenase